MMTKTMSLELAKKKIRAIQTDMNRELKENKRTKIGID